MMTDEERAARLAALAGRRTNPRGGASGTGTQRPSADAAPAPGRSRPKRPHAAAGGRLIAAALSTGAAIVFTAALANAGARTASPPTSPPAAPVVARVVRSTGQASTAAVPAKRSAPVITAAPATANANARSRAS